MRKLPDGRYLMTYEVCSTDGSTHCEVYLCWSADGAGWGTASDLGTRVTAVDGQYFAHAPTLAWADNGTANGRLLLVGQVLLNADGSVSAGIFVNTEGGAGGWYETNAPVSVPDPYDNYCPNYSSALLPPADGRLALEIATGYAGTTCQAYFATASVIGSGATNPATSGAAYRLVNVESRLCLDVTADSRVVGGNIEQRTCNGLGPQNFVATANGSGYYTLRGPNSGLCVEVAGDATTAGANVDQGHLHRRARPAVAPHERGQWLRDGGERGQRPMPRRHGGSVLPGANVEQWTCNGQSPQIWNLQQR